MEKLPWRELATGEEPDFPVGTLLMSTEVEHSCCYSYSIKRLSIMDRGDGSRLQMWTLVAEFDDEADAEVCLVALGGQAENTDLSHREPGVVAPAENIKEIKP